MTSTPSPPCLRARFSPTRRSHPTTWPSGAGRGLICRRARELGLEPLPGETNFQLIRVGDTIEPAVLVERLSERRYLVKGPFSAPCLRDCVRVTLGPPKLMAEFCDALRLVLDGG